MPDIFIKPVLPVEYIRLITVRSPDYAARFRKLFETEKQEEPMASKLMSNESIQKLCGMVEKDSTGFNRIWIDQTGTERVVIDPALLQSWAEREDGSALMRHHVVSLFSRQGLHLYATDTVLYADDSSVKILRGSKHKNAVGQTFVPVTVADEYAHVLMNDGTTRKVNVTEIIRQNPPEIMPWTAPAGGARGVLRAEEIKSIYYDAAQRDYLYRGGQGGAPMPKVGDTVQVPLGTATHGAFRRFLDHAMVGGKLRGLTEGEHEICRATADSYTGSPHSPVTRTTFETDLFGKLMVHSLHRTSSEIRDIVNLITNLLMDSAEGGQVSIRRKVTAHAAVVQSFARGAPITEAVRKIFGNLDKPAAGGAVSGHPGWYDNGPVKGVADYKVCDTSNNGPEVADEKQLSVGIYIPLPTAWTPGADEQARDRTFRGPASVEQAPSRLHRAGDRPTETKIFTYALDRALGDDLQAIARNVGDSLLTNAQFSGKFTPQGLHELTISFPDPGQPMPVEAVNVVQGLEDGSVRFDGCTKVTCGDHKINPMPFVCTDCGMSLLQIVRKSVRTCVPVTAPPALPTHSERVAPRTHPAPTGGAFRTRAGGQGLFLPNGE